MGWESPRISSLKRGCVWADGRLNASVYFNVSPCRDLHPDMLAKVWDGSSEVGEEEQP